MPCHFSFTESHVLSDPVHVVLITASVPNPGAHGGEQKLLYAAKSQCEILAICKNHLGKLHTSLQIHAIKCQSSF